MHHCIRDIKTDTPRSSLTPLPILAIGLCVLYIFAVDVVTKGRYSACQIRDLWLIGPIRRGIDSPPPPPATTASKGLFSPAVAWAFGAEASPPVEAMS